MRILIVFAVEINRSVESAFLSVCVTMATNVLELVTTSTYLVAKWLLGKKVNFMPLERAGLWLGTKIFLCSITDKDFNWFRNWPVKRRTPGACSVVLVNSTALSSRDPTLCPWVSEDASLWFLKEIQKTFSLCFYHVHNISHSPKLPLVFLFNLIETRYMFSIS